MALELTGFTRPRLPEIKQTYDDNFTEALGPVNTEPDSVTGQIIGIFSEALDAAYETLEDNYHAMYPFSAEGVSLDGAVSFIGLERLGASATTVVAVCYGTESTFIPTGSLARAGTRQYVTTSDSIISRANAVDLEITVTNVLNNTTYQILTGGVLSSYTSDANATANEIAAGLAADFDPLVFTATSTGEVIKITSIDKTSDFAVSLDANLTITKLGSPVTFTCVDLGKVVLPVKALNAIDSPTFGWDSISNLVAGATGRDVETDAELRLRHQASVRSIGAATVESMRARILQEVPEVTAVQIYENRKGFEVNSMPSHSFEAVISGGANQDLFVKLWQVKPAGIETYGNLTGDVLDENGDTQQISFSRPITKFAWIRVSIDQLYLEEPLTPTVILAIENAVVAYGNTLGVGVDIITQRFYGEIYSVTSGIGKMTIEVGLTSGELDTPTYSTNNISIARAEIAQFANQRVTVVGV